MKNLTSRLLNHLYYGDNLQILREHIAPESIDVIYLDPPFNSKARYSKWFISPTGEFSSAQSRAFDDTWRWTAETSLREYNEVLGGHHAAAATMLRGARSFLHTSAMMAYLTMMTVRMVELYRVLKPSGVLFLHCDPNADAYLRIMLDAIFGPQMFVNSIARQRQSAHNDAKQGSRNFGRIHDTILVYAKDKDYTWNVQRKQYTDGQLDVFRYKDERGVYTLRDMSGPGGVRNGNPMYEVMGIARPWRHAEFKSKRGKPSMADLRAMPTEREVAKRYKGEWVPNNWHRVEGRIVQTSEGTVPLYKQYREECGGPQLQDIWSESELWNMPSGSHEAVGFDTQKPLALLNRILMTASNQGEVILDPFCGCGSTIISAEKLGRRWIGIDVTHVAIAEVEDRLNKIPHDLLSKPTWKTHGRPRDSAGATRLFTDNPHEFEAWALSLVLAKPYQPPTYGGDEGVEGNGMGYVPAGDGKTYEKLIASVKGGQNLNPAMVRDLAGTMQREGAKIGVLIMRCSPTKGMIKEANAHGLYVSQYGSVPKIQLLTIDDWFAGHRLQLPPTTRVEQQVPLHLSADG